MKKVFLALTCIMLFSCQGSDSFSGFYFQEFYTGPESFGEMNIYIKGDTLFKNRNYYDAFNNRLEYILLTDEEIDTFSGILNKLSEEELKPYYKKKLTEYNFYWGFTFRKKNNKSYMSNIMDTINPKNLDRLYSFVINKAKSSKKSKEVNKKSEYNKIKIQNIRSLSNENDLEFSSNIIRREMLYMIWHNLLTVNADDFYHIENISKYEYEVDFSYLLNSTNRIIEKIYLSRDNHLAVKFLNSEGYKCIRLRGMPNKVM